MKNNVLTRNINETGASLATRALGYGTLYAFTGCGLLFFTGTTYNHFRDTILSSIRYLQNINFQPLIHILVSDFL